MKEAEPAPAAGEYSEACNNSQQSQQGSHSSEKEMVKSSTTCSITDEFTFMKLEPLTDQDLRAQGGQALPPIYVPERQRQRIYELGGLRQLIEVQQPIQEADEEDSELESIEPSDFTSSEAESISVGSGILNQMSPEQLS